MTEIIRKILVYLQPKDGIENKIYEKYVIKVKAKMVLAP